MANFEEIDKDLQDRLDNIEAIKGATYRKLLQMDITLGSAFVAMRKLISANEIPTEVKLMLASDILSTVHLQVLNELSNTYGEELTKDMLTELHEDAKRTISNTREHVLRHIKELGL